jgi:hypothetical protein
MPKTDFTVYGTKKVTLKPPMFMRPNRIMLQMTGLRRAEAVPARVIEVPCGPATPDCRERWRW